MTEQLSVRLLLAVDFADVDDDVDRAVAEMVLKDAADLVESHWNVKAEALIGFNRLEAVARAILDEHYPEDIFGTADDPDSDASDPGVRLVRALRACLGAQH